jgi:hypothetical protein
VNRRWPQPPVTAAGSPQRDRGLDGALDQRLPLRAGARTQHWVTGLPESGTDRRSLEAHSPRLTTEATSARTHQTQNQNRFEGGNYRAQLTTIDPKA